jgi:hydrogenase maturation factor HypF (carbamoyltransferase family)
MRIPKDKDIAIVNLPVKVVFHNTEYGMLMKVIGGECVIYNKKSAKRIINFSEEVLYSGDSGIKIPKINGRKLSKLVGINKTK